MVEGRKCSEWRGWRGGGGMLCGLGRVVAAATPAIAGARPAGWAVVEPRHHLKPHGAHGHMAV